MSRTSNLSPGGMRVGAAAWALLICLSCFAQCSTSAEEELLLITVATGQTDGFKRYLRSAQVNGLKGKVVGMGEEGMGGEMEKGPGGGHKINLVKKELEEYKDRNDLVLMFTDAYDVLLLSDAATILRKFRTGFGDDTRVVFSAESFCWPDAGLAYQYPEVADSQHEKRFLNSGGFIGYASDIYAIFHHDPEVQDTDDDQLYYTKIFLDEESRKKYKIKLDTKSLIFHNLHGATGDLEMRYEDETRPYLFNVHFETVPSVVHANGPTKILLNSYGNYVPGAWNAQDQCTACWEDSLDPLPPSSTAAGNSAGNSAAAEEFPQIVLAVFIEQPTPFIEEFFQKVLALDFPKANVDLFIHNGAEYHAKDLAKFVKHLESLDQPLPPHETYHSIQIIDHEDEENEWEARTAGVQHCNDLKCDYYFSLDANAHIDNPETLRLLIEQNREVVAPVLIRPYHAWSNFWGALNKDGFYGRSNDYMDIVNGKRRGLWNVPFISSAYLIKGSLINEPEAPEQAPNFAYEGLDADMAMCANFRRAGVFMHASNRLEFGHLVHTDAFKTDQLHNELWEMENNRWDWEKRYLHANYSDIFLEDDGSGVASSPEQPCPDVYWFPIVSDRFADDFVQEMEHYGKWSDGSNNDKRLEGGYENVPTRDIHMNQVGYEKHWLHFLETYVRPLQEKVFIGYFHQPPRAIMNFIVRYRPEEQPNLRPHHDSSTYTINIALNQAGVDYEGGGCHFIRYNCKVTTTKKGWMFMHPGKLTHYHEGLTTTKGTRYIMISFVDP